MPRNLSKSWSREARGPAQRRVAAGLTAGLTAGRIAGLTAGRGELEDLRTAHALAGCQGRRRCLLVASLPPCPPVEAALLNPPSASPKPSWRDGPKPHPLSVRLTF